MQGFRHRQSIPYLDEAVMEDQPKKLAGDGGVQGGGRPDDIPHRQLDARAGLRVEAGRELAQCGGHRRRGVRRRLRRSRWRR